MKKILFTLTILTALLFASSCQHDWDNGGGNGSGTSGNEGFLLKINVPGSNINTRMTIPSETGEDDVQVLHVLFFQATGAQQFIDVVEIRDRDTDGSLTGDKLDLSTPLLVRFREAPLLNNGTHYKLLVVANIDAYINNFSLNSWKANFVGQSYNNVLNSGQLDRLPLTGTTPDFNLPDEQIASDRLLMSAKAEKPANHEEVSVPLVRAVVRVDVNMSNRLTSGDYTLVSASIWNVPMNASIWNSENNNFVNMISGKAVQRVEALTGFEGNGFKGLLYTFENRQRNISQSDRHTTAVVLGILDKTKTPEVLSYHRVNVSLPFAGQDLLRNTVHNVTVNRVLGDGAATEEDAYNSHNSMLQVSVNNTDMDSRGVILIDGDDVLVIPTNRITFTPEGDIREYTIFTYSPDATKRLGVSAITMEPGLSALLSGSTLTVSATPSVDARKGFIELAFGNIRARIEVVQESSFVEFLELNLKMHDIEIFPNDVPSGSEVVMITPDGLPDYVQVTSSGEWTATIYNPEAFGFSFTGNTHYTIFGNTGGTFQLSAMTSNANDFMRYGFVIVSLVSNPNINKVVVLRQQGTDIVRIFDNNPPYLDELDSPRTYFTANGDLDTGKGSEINVYRITHSSDRLSSIQLIEGANFFNFEIIDETVAGVTIIKVTANENPNDGIVLRGRLALRSPYGGFATIDLEQAYHTLTLTPEGVITSISTFGGTTANIAVSSSIPTWTATMTMGNHQAGDGRRLVQHIVTLEDHAGNPIAATPYTDATKLRVQFPKVYYPNRQIPITATITVSNGFFERTIEVSQQTLMPRGMVISNNGTGTDGMLYTGTGNTNGTSGYNKALQRIPWTSMGSTFDGTTNYIHVSNRLSTAVINTAFTNRVTMTTGTREGILVLMQASRTASNVSDVTGTNSPFHSSRGWNISGSAGGSNSQVDPAHSDTKLYGWIVGGNGPAGEVVLSAQINTSFNDGTAGGWVTAYPTNNSVSLLRHISPATNKTLVIDPVNNLVYIGSGFMFNNGTAYGSPEYPTTNTVARRVVDNLAAYVSLAASYGSHFTDLFIEPSWPAVPGRPAQPAPWDITHWGDNAGVTNQ
jgi:hypothetical protein